MLPLSSNAFSKKHFAVVHTILVCTYTNVAVDNLVEGFVTAGLDPVRIGYGQTKLTLQEHSLESKFEKHPLYDKYKVASEESKNLEKQLNRTYARLFEKRKQGRPPGELSRLKCHLEHLIAKRRRLESNERAINQQIRTEVMTSADVVRFFTSKTFSELTSTVRCALPVSVLALGRWTSWTSL